MADFQLNKAPKEDGSFFGKNGTIQQVSDAIGSIQSLQSSNATSRATGLAGLVKTILEIFA